MEFPAPSPDPSTYAFRLFSTSKPQINTKQTPAATADLSQLDSKQPVLSGVIRIKLHSPALGEASDATGSSRIFSKRSRPLSFYIATPAPPRKKQEFIESAVEGEDVRVNSRNPWYGWRMESRVISAELSSELRGDQASLDMGANGTSAGNEAKRDTEDIANHRNTRGSNRHKARKGKKTRLKLRINFRAKDEAKRKRAAEELDKEAYLRKKKTKLNRAKQIKKRENARKEKELLTEHGSGRQHGDILRGTECKQHENEAQSE